MPIDLLASPQVKMGNGRYSLHVLSKHLTKCANKLRGRLDINGNWASVQELRHQVGLYPALLTAMQQGHCVVKSWLQFGRRFFAAILPANDGFWYVWVTVACGLANAARFRCEIRMNQVDAKDSVILNTQN